MGGKRLLKLPFNYHFLAEQTFPTFPIRFLLLIPTPALAEPGFVPNRGMESVKESRFLVCLFVG